MSANPIRLLARLRLSGPKRYWFAVGTIVLATLIRWLLNPVFGAQLPYAIFFAAILAIAWISGLGPALMGVALSIISADFFFMAPKHNLVMTSRTDVMFSVGFAFVGIVSGAISDAYRRALDSSQAAYRLSRRQQAELRQIYSSTPIGLGFLDENLRYLRVNDALAVFNGVPADQHPGRHISEILSPEIAAKVMPLLKEILSTGKPITDLEFQGPKTRNGEELRYVRASFYPVQLGEIRGVHGIVEDITAEKKAQEELKAVEAQLRYGFKMEAVGRLAGGIAHDFNNLLMVISNYTELLLQQVQDNPSHAKKLHAIAAASQRAALLTRQLLAFGRKQPMQARILEFDLLVQNLQQVLCSALRENVDLVLNLNAHGAHVRIDPSLLEQALMNLAANARDAMPQGGKLIIKTLLRRFEQEETHSLFTISPGEYVEISLIDSGCGISPELQTRIFDPFFTTKEQGRGSGLGLSMVYGIVKQSSGYIEVRSVEGEGTTFVIWLPTTTQVSVQPVAPVAIPQKGSGTILLAEDESTLRQAICESLTELGYRVIEAADGLEALAAMERDRAQIDLLLTDAVMPNMGGLDLIQRVRSAHPEVKSILMSGYSNSDSPTAIPGNEGLVFLQKPFAQAELAKAVRKVLATSAPI
jgi:PAS domain S-box-containing protein